MNLTEQNCKYMAEEISEKLVGCRIMSALLSEDSESFGLLLAGKKGPIQVWVNCDPEGNGPGWLSIEEVWQ